MPEKLPPYLRSKTSTYVDQSLIRYVKGLLPSLRVSDVSMLQFQPRLIPQGLQSILCACFEEVPNCTISSSIGKTGFQNRSSPHSVLKRIFEACISIQRAKMP